MDKIEDNTVTAEENASFESNESERLWKTIFALNVEAAELKAAVAELKAEVVALKAVVAPPKKDVLNLVAVPEKGVTVPEKLFFDGERCLTLVDENGFRHFQVPRKHASVLLFRDAPVRFHIAGQSAPVKVSRMAGLSAETAVFLPHEFDGKEWKPVK
jgi:hypothetical protein